MAHAALKTWELENAVKLVDSSRDQIYNYSTAKAQAENDAHPWRTDPHHFKTILISAVALLKMVMHARSGGALEVMGLMQGYVDGPNIVVTDAFRLPVEGTETRVNAQDEANEYMVNFLTRAREVGQLENAVGWYHSHPGYGCWLSGIDVDTEMNQQRWNDPFCAVVIDPDRTISAGKVEIGAFRTFPDGHKPSADDGDVAGQEAADAEGFQTIPLAKIDDFGAHAARYYSMEVAHFKSSLDSRLLESLWNKYWVSTLSSSPLFTNRDYGTKQMAELALKIKQAEGKAKSQSRAGGQLGALGKEAKRTREEFEKIIKAGNKIAAEEQSGLAAAQIKEKLFCDLVGTAGLESAAQAGAALPQEAVMAQR